MADLVQLLNEDGFLADGNPYDGIWISQSLNRRDLGRLYTLPWVEILYSAAEETIIEVSASGDGALTWPVVKTVTLPATGQDPEAVGRVTAPVRVSGTDLRIRVVMDQMLVSRIHVYIPPLIERGKHHNAVR